MYTNISKTYSIEMLARTMQRHLDIVPAFKTILLLIHPPVRANDLLCGLLFSSSQIIIIEENCQPGIEARQQQHLR